MESSRSRPGPRGSSKTVLTVLDLGLDTCVLDSITGGTNVFYGNT